jgi:hypothetical protein
MRRRLSIAVAIARGEVGGTTEAAAVGDSLDRQIRFGQQQTPGLLQPQAPQCRAQALALVATIEAIEVPHRDPHLQRDVTQSDGVAAVGGHELPRPLAEILLPARSSITAQPRIQGPGLGQYLGQKEAGEEADPLALPGCLVL